MDAWLATFTEHPWEPQLVVLLSTAYAMLLGGVIGFERELKNRPAGFRTHMLVAGAAALLVGLGDLIANHFAAQHSEQILRIDRETDEPAPISNYGRSKWSGERAVAEFAGDVPITIVRPGSVFGPRNREARLVGLLRFEMQSGRIRSLQIVTEGATYGGGTFGVAVRSMPQI